MKKKQKDKLIKYLSDNSIDIYSINFIAGGNISEDELSLYFYGKENGERFIFSAQVDPKGKETITRKAKVN